MLLTPELLLRAYAVGIFPMAESRRDPQVHWIDPDMRGIIPLDRVHLSRKMRRAVLKSPFEVRCDTAFESVVEGCAEPLPNRPDTWINPTIQKLYTELFEQGFAHSVEAWDNSDPKEPVLVGGLYGVSLGSAFFGESMFSRATNASKIALVHLVIRLRKAGYVLLDTQFTTPHLRQFGAIDVPREHYKAQLTQALSSVARFPAELTDAELEAGLGELRSPG